MSINPKKERRFGMTAIVDIYLSPKNKLKRFVLPPVSKKIITVNQKNVTLYTCNPLYTPLFPTILAKLSQKHNRIFLTEHFRRYPHIFREEPTADCFLEHLEGILQCFSDGHPLDVAVLCEREDSRLLEVLSALSHFCHAVSVYTQDDVFFETVSEKIFADCGLSVNQRPLNVPLQQQVLVALSAVPPSLSFGGELFLNLAEILTNSDERLLLDFTSDVLRDSSEEFHRLHIKHCYFIEKEQPITKLIRKIEKKS